MLNLETNRIFFLRQVTCLAVKLMEAASVLGGWGPGRKAAVECMMQLDARPVSHVSLLSGALPWELSMTFSLVSPMQRLHARRRAPLHVCLDQERHR